VPAIYIIFHLKNKYLQINPNMRQATEYARKLAEETMWIVGKGLSVNQKNKIKRQLIEKLMVF